MKEIVPPFPVCKIPLEAWAETLSEHDGHKWSCLDIASKFNDKMS